MNIGDLRAMNGNIPMDIAMEALSRGNRRAEYYYVVSAWVKTLELHDVPHVLAGTIGDFVDYHFGFEDPNVVAALKLVFDKDQIDFMIKCLDTRYSGSYAGCARYLSTCLLMGPESCFIEGSMIHVRSDKLVKSRLDKWSIHYACSDGGSAFRGWVVKYA